MSPKKKDQPERDRAVPAPPVSNTELDVLKVLWERGPSTVREVQDHLDGRGLRWAYTTVQTLLHRLRAKSCVTSTKAGIALVFRAEISREGLVRGRLLQLADQLTDGLTSPLVHALVKERGLSPGEIEEFRRLVEEASARTEADRTRRKRRG